MFILKSTHDKIIAELKEKPNLSLFKLDYSEYTLQVVGELLEWDNKEIEISINSDVIFWTNKFPNFWAATPLSQNTDLKPGIQP